MINKIDDFQLFRDVWLFWKKYKTIEDNEEYWNNLALEGQKLGKQYNNKFAVDLILAIITQIERMAKYNEKGD